MIGQTLGKYRVQDRIGRGGMGTVYLAVDETLRREVAIKVLNSELNDPEIARRFRAEAVTVARLNHPGIATVYELFEYDSQWLMVMEFVRGETLEHMVERMGPLPIERVGDLVIQALTALAHAHSMGVVHRDLKPANLMVTESGIVKVMDFGIARVAGSEHLTTAGFMMGTPAYMSPEQVLGHEIDARADLYAMGVVLYRLATARLPFKGDSPFAMAQSQVNDPPTPVGLMRAGMPPWIEQVIGRALSKAPEDRYQTADEFRETIKRGLAGLPIEVAPNAFVPPELLLTSPPGTMRTMPQPGQPSTGSLRTGPSGAVPVSGAVPISGVGPTSGAVATSGLGPTSGAVPISGAVPMPTGPVADPDMTVMAGRMPEPLTATGQNDLTVMSGQPGAPVLPMGPGTGSVAAPMGTTGQTAVPTGTTGQTAMSAGGTGQVAAPAGPMGSTGTTAQTAMPVGASASMPPPKSAAAAKKSSAPIAAIAAAVIVVGTLGAFFWYRSHAAAAAAAAADAAAAQIAAATPPAPVVEVPPVPPPTTPDASALPPAPVTTASVTPPSTPAEDKPVTASAPAPAPGARAAATPDARGAVAPPPVARGPVPTPEVVEPHLAFSDEKILILNGKKGSEQDVVINFVAGQISVAPKKGGAAIWSVAYKKVAHATYIHAKDPKWDATLPSPPDGLEISGFMRGARHWLVIQAKAENPGYVILHLDDSNWGEVLDTLEARSGFKVDRLGPGGK